MADDDHRGIPEARVRPRFPLRALPPPVHVVSHHAAFLTAPLAESEWSEFARAIDPEHGFVMPAWFEAWGRRLLPYENWRGPLRYLVARTGDGRIAAALPLATQRRFGIPVASLAGLYWPFRSPLIPRVDAPDACAALAGALSDTSAPVALRFGPAAATDVGMTTLVTALAQRGWRLHRSVIGTTHEVDLPATWGELELRIGKRLRWNAQYYERKLARDGALEIRCVRGAGNGEWAGAIDDLGRIEQQSWQFRDDGRLRFHGERNRSFWTDLLVDGRFGDVAAAWIMRFNGAPASFCFCLDCGEVRYILANNYAESVHRYSTGSVLYKHVFRDAVDSGTIRRVNIGLGDPGYKSRWSARPAFALVDWLAFRPGPRGAALDLAWRSGMAMRKRRDRPSERVVA